MRHRVDGVLALARTLPRAVGPALVSRIKILSGLDIADRLASAGRPRARRDQRRRGRPARLDAARVARREGRHPRARRPVDGARRSTAWAFIADELERIERLLQSREGLILVTGPTGSGKTTTLYAALRRLKERGVNIVTVEDPIEYRLPGIVQVQVNEKAGLTFATALRSIMRQDPDVVLIGEIRDRETAEIAIQASLTGHLVLSTLHTNDAPSAVTRLIDIGVASYKIATAVKGVLAQRLVRRLCASCRGVRHGRVPGVRRHGLSRPAGARRGARSDRPSSSGGSRRANRPSASPRPRGPTACARSGSRASRTSTAGRTTIDEVRRVATPDDRRRAPARPSRRAELLGRASARSSLISTGAPSSCATTSTHGRARAAAPAA